MEIITRILYILILYIIAVTVTISKPTWENELCIPNFPEDTPLGTWLVNITATTDISGASLTFSTDNILTTSLVNLTDPWSNGPDRYTVGVVLIAELDRDFTPQRKILQFKVADTAATDYRSCELFVDDVNDNAPIFLNLPYNTKVPEDVSVDSVIYGNISVYDPDTGDGGLFTLSMVSDDINDERFVLEWTAGSGSALLKLKSPFDYELRTSYAVYLSAVDNGRLSSYAEIVITIEDVQDTPPYFLQPIYRAAILEHSPVNMSVIQIQAEDGDRGIPRPILYKIIKGRTDIFYINETTGWIIQMVSVDRDDDMMRDINGVFELIVQAYEVNATADEDARSDVTVTIAIDDINDNPPTFNASTTYTAYVRDDIPSNSLISFDGEGYMNVFDKDQGTNAYFTMTIEKDGKEFLALQPSPLEIYYDAFVLIRIVNSSILREYSGQHLAFEVIATETKTPEKLSGTAAVVLTIETTEEPTTTPPPPEEDPLRAPDIVVFVVGFLVLLNIVTSVVICVLMTRKKKGGHQQGLVRNGSKYYVTVSPKTPGLSISAKEGSPSNGINNTSIMQEIP